MLQLLNISGLVSKYFGGRTARTCSSMTALRSEGIPLSAWLKSNASRP